MKIGLLSYPMLWQRTGGLQIQIIKTLDSLKNIGHEVKLVDILQDKLCDFDLIHVFYAGHGTGRILEEAKLQGVKTVITPLIHADRGWATRRRNVLASWLTARLSQYQHRTTFDEICATLAASDHILPMSSAEMETMLRVYNQPRNKMTVVPNGIDPQFLVANAGPFRKLYGQEEKFVLIVGSVSLYKNQLGVIRATRAEGWPVVLLGQVAEEAYLTACLEEGEGRVRHLGVLDHDDPLLASAYAAAGVTVLASQGESFGLTAVESLAAGTSAVITRANGLGLAPKPPLLAYVDPQDTAALAAAISAAMRSGENIPGCRALVAGLSWQKAAETIEAVYRNVTK